MELFRLLALRDADGLFLSKKRADNDEMLEELKEHVTFLVEKVMRPLEGVHEGAVPSALRTSVEGFCRCVSVVFWNPSHSRILCSTGSSRKHSNRGRLIRTMGVFAASSMPDK